MWCDLLHITYPTQFETPSTLSQNKKTPPSYLSLYGGHKSGQHVWLGMVANMSEKLNTVIDTYSRPRTTTLDRIRPDQKQGKENGATATPGAFNFSFAPVLRVYEYERPGFR